MLEALLPPSRREPLATAILGRQDIGRLLTMPECIAAVENAFQRHSLGDTIPPGLLGTHVDGGAFHVKTAGLRGVAAHGDVYAAKINANFPDNHRERGLPTIQGVIALFDATNGRVLALMDSAAITSVRTAAATAVAARYLAPAVARVTLCGCGEQGGQQLLALQCVRTLERAWVYDVDHDRARRFAAEMSMMLAVEITALEHLDDAARDTTIWITCTPSRRWFLGRAHVERGAFVAAVGADNPQKQEIEPELLAASAVVADVLEQSATIGDLHHALESGAMRREDVRAELADVASGKKKGRHSDDEIVVFDSTGTALEDVAAALMVYDRAIVARAGAFVDLSGSLTPVTGHEPVPA